MSGCERRDVRDIIVGVVICKIRIDSGGERERRERGVLRFEPSEFWVGEENMVSYRDSHRTVDDIPSSLASLELAASPFPLRSPNLLPLWRLGAAAGAAILCPGRG